MAYEFKDIATVDLVESVADTANVLIEEDGIIKRAAKSKVGVGSEWDAVITTSNIPLYTSTSDVTLTQFDFASIKEKFLAGEEVIIMLHTVFNYGDDYEVWVKSNGISYNSTSDILSIGWITPSNYGTSLIGSVGLTISIDSTGEVVGTDRQTVNG